MEGQIPQYPRLSADTVGFANSLNRGDSNSIEFTSCGQLYILRPDTAIQSSDFSAVVQCNINEHSMRLSLDAGFCDWLLSDWLPLEDLVALPDDLRKSIIIAALNPIADFFAEHSTGNFNVEDIECQTTRPSHSSLLFNLLSVNGGTVGRAFADIDEQATDILRKIWQVSAKPVPGIDIEDLPVQVEVVIDSITLSLEKFRRLEENDIILLNAEFSEPKEVYARIGDNISFSSVLYGSKLTIKKPEGGMMADNERPSINQETEDSEIEDQTIDDSVDADLNIEPELYADEPRTDELSADELHANVPNSPSEDNQPTASRVSDLGDLPVELLFIVDRFKIPLKEVEQVKPGYVFELNKKTVGQVEILANGTPIGNGELVEISDRAGVRIIELYHRIKQAND